MRRALPYNVLPRKHNITFDNSPDPINAEKLTLDQMRRFPYSLWLKYIEPRIIIMGKADTDCWCWDIRNKSIKIEKFVPQVFASWRPDDEHPAISRLNARKFIMEMFYEFPNHYQIFRNKEICTSFNCVRPSHLIAAPRNCAIPKYAGRVE